MNRLVSVAPMMDCTDRHERYFLRLISKNTLLYTEMVVDEETINDQGEVSLDHVSESENQEASVSEEDTEASNS